MTEPRTVVLSGFMASGKSTAGPVVAARLGVPFVDTDAEIERSAGRTIATLWKEEGEASFRAREAEVVERALSEQAPTVIAVGGGVVANPRLRRLAVDRALVVTLTASAETRSARIHDAETRPNLAVGGNPSLRAQGLLAARADAYAECHLTIATDRLTPDGIATAVSDLVSRDPLLVPLGGRSYAIDVGVNASHRVAEAIARLSPSSLVVVTDENVKAARGEALTGALAGLGVRVSEVVLPAGEANKTLPTVSRIWDAALGARSDRDSVVLAFGGGVVGDLAGFAASALLRGVRFVQVPTTLLAMVDSSVGGKTGFDHPEGKNLIGAFHQPSAVVADLAHLTTLDPRERAAGLAEVVKIAVATDEGLLEQVEANAVALREGSPSALMPVVRRAIQAKIRVVRDDERETGPRALLNLGHTLGHALEAHGGFSRWLHGEAVALGTVLEMRATAAAGWTEPGLVERITGVFRTLGLPTDCERRDIAQAWPFVGSDKKRAKNAIRLPVVVSSGRADVRSVALPELESHVFGALERWGVPSS